MKGPLVYYHNRTFPIAACLQLQGVRICIFLLLQLLGFGIGPGCNNSLPSHGQQAVGRTDWTHVPDHLDMYFEILRVMIACTHPDGFGAEKMASRKLVSTGKPEWTNVPEHLDMYIEIIRVMIACTLWC